MCLGLVQVIFTVHNETLTPCLTKECKNTHLTGMHLSRAHALAQGL